MGAPESAAGKGRDLDLRRWRDLSGVLALLLVMGWILGRMGFFDPGRLAGGLANFGRFAAELFPPDLSVLPAVLGALAETVEMAFAGTFLGFILSFPLGVLGTRTLFPRPVVLGVRLLVAMIRTVPSLLWAVIMVIVVGLGPLAGTLALAVYTVGYLAKLYAEILEGVDPEVLEAVRGLGAHRRHIVRYVLWPESANTILSQLLFMLEYNIRSSTVLGLVGAGGVGFYMQVYISTLAYGRLATVLLAVLAIVLLMDGLSAWARRRYLLQS